MVPNTPSSFLDIIVETNNLVAFIFHWIRHWIINRLELLLILLMTNLIWFWLNKRPHGEPTLFATGMDDNNMKKEACVAMPWFCVYTVNRNLRIKSRPHHPQVGFIYICTKVRAEWKTCVCVDSNLSTRGLAAPALL